MQQLESILSFNALPSISCLQTMAVRLLPVPISMNSFNALPSISCLQTKHTTCTPEDVHVFEA